MKPKYRLSDVQAQIDIIRAAWDRMKAQDAHRRMLMGQLPDLNYSPFNLPLAVQKCAARAYRHLHGRSKYMPHQGKRECARRRRQMRMAENFDVLHFSANVEGLPA